MAELLDHDPGWILRGSDTVCGALSSYADLDARQSR
jgi:hypothetical protein